MKSGHAKKIDATPTPATTAPPLLHGAFVKHLVANGRTNEAARQTCVDVDLPPPSDVALDGLRPAASAKKSKPGAKKKAPAMKVMVPSPSAEAMALLRNPRARELVEAAIILNVPASAVVEMLATHFGVSVTPDVLDEFARMFFDVSVVTRAQLRVLVQARVRQAVKRVVGDEEDGPAARRAIAADARTVAVSLTSTPAAWSAVLLALGLPLPRFDLGKAVAELERTAAARAAQALLRGGPDDERRAAGFAGVLRDLRQVHEGLGSPAVELNSRLLEFRLKHDDARLPSVNDFRRLGHDVSTDVLPLGAVNDEHEIDPDAQGDGHDADFTGSWPVDMEEP